MILAVASPAPVSAADVAVYAAKTFIVLAFLVVGFRLFGKREMAQLNIYDLAMLMALSNAIQNAMTGGRGNLPIGLATSTTILAGGWVATKAIQRHPALERPVVGWPTVLLSNGVVLARRLRREHVSPAELEEAIRAHGLADPGQVRLAVLEVDGSISIIPADRATGGPA